MYHVFNYEAPRNTVQNFFVFRGNKEPMRKIKASPMSTSLDINTAAGFGKYLYKLKIPIGMPYLFVRYGIYSEEKEVLIPPVKLTFLNTVSQGNYRNKKNPGHLIKTTMRPLERFNPCEEFLLIYKLIKSNFKKIKLNFQK